MRQFNFINTSVLVLAALLAAQLSFAQSDQGDTAREFGLGQPQSVAEVPVSNLRSRLESLPPQAQANALRWLQDFSFPAADVPAIRVDDVGNVFYADTFLTGLDEAGTASGTPTSYAEVPASTLDDVFLLHSKPGAPNVVFVDFDGDDITGTAWNSGNASTLYAIAYNTEGDTSSFTSNERKKMVDIWHRVAEDLAPYDIDVTTEDPGTFNSRTGHLLITRSTDANGVAINCTGCGGVAYVGVFGSSNYPYYSPALVFYDKLGSGFEHYVAEAASHEFGHNLGLSHDGDSTTGYYRGHGSGVVSWAPIMGVGYYNNVTQWSKGEYADANNSQDDLAIIDGKLGYESDDHGDSFAAASALAVDPDGTVLSSNPALDPHNELPANKGIIGSRDDVDVFWFSSGSGNIDLSIRPAWDAFYRATNYRGANLDIEAELFDVAGGSIALNDPTSDTATSISATVSAGTYYLLVTGVGNPTVPYSDYGSLGQYFIDGSVPPSTPDETAPTPNPMTWASAPEAISESAISMTATTATDETSAVQYQFRCVAGGPDGCVNSAWQSGTSYTATGLTASTSYSFQVLARDQSGNTTGASGTASAETLTPPPYTNFVATSDTAGAGSVNGSVGDTVADDGATQSITERESGGKPSNRHTYLEHRWNFDVSAGATVTVYANAWRDAADADTFDFEFSLNGGASFQALFNVAATNADNLQSASIAGAPSGSIIIRVIDTDQTPGERNASTVMVDHLFIQVGNPSNDPLDGGPGGLSATAASSSQIDLAWANGSSNEAGFTVERSPDGSSGWLEISDLPPGSTAYSDTGLAASTQYFYRVSAYNAVDVSAYTTANATTQEAPAISLTATGYKSKGRHGVILDWTGADTVDIYRDGTNLGAFSGGSYDDFIGNKGGGVTYTHRVCVTGSTTDCSNVTATDF